MLVIDGAPSTWGGAPSRSSRSASGGGFRGFEPPNQVARVRFREATLREHALASDAKIIIIITSNNYQPSFMGPPPSARGPSRSASSAYGERRPCSEA